MAIKRHTGSTFADCSTHKRWTGSAWQTVTVAKRWNGSGWTDLLPGGGGEMYTYTFSPSADIWTYLVNTQQSSHLHEPIHGQYEGASTMRKSILVLPAAARTTLAGKTIKSVRLYLSRKNDGHGATTATVSVKTRSLDTHPTTFSAGTNANAYANNVTLKRGEAKWITLYNSVGEGIRDGSVKSLVLWTTSTALSGYIKFGSTIKLEIKYA